MPTFGNVQLQNLLEPQKPLFNGDQDDPDSDPVNGGPTPRHVYISPVLYTTPEQVPTPEYSSPDSNFPSPYVVNNKRRNAPRKNDSGDVPDLPPENEGCGLNNEPVVGGNSVIENDDFDDEGFLDTRSETMSVGSDDFSVGRKIQSSDVVSAQGEFFDAIDDDFSSDVSNSSAHSCGSRIEPELQSARLMVLEEIEKRRAAEEALSLMRIQWDRISSLMSEAGLTFPAMQQLESSSIGQLSQEIVVTRFVDEVIGRAQARSEAEEAAAAIIESKDQEISRLQDRLQYFETVNHEMSQRKLVEVARRQQEKKKRNRRRWIWSLIGVSFAVGAAFAAASYFPEATKFVSLIKSGDLSDSSFVSTESESDNAPLESRESRK